MLGKQDSGESPRGFNLHLIDIEKMSGATNKSQVISR